MFKIRVRGLAGVVIGVGLLWGAPAVRAANGITALGRPLGGSFVGSAYGVSADGSVAVGSTGISPTAAFRWTAAGMIVLPGLGGDGFSDYATGVSGDGAVVVGQHWNANGKVEPSRWTAGGGTVGLGFVSDSDANGTANAANRDGSVIVGRSGSYPFRWTEATGPVSLGSLPGSTLGGEANAVSRDGAVVVGQAELQTGGPAFRWTASTGMVQLSNATFSSNSVATATNADGSVVAGFGSTRVFGLGRDIAFRWTEGAGMVSLGALSAPRPSDTYSAALGMSDDGNVIVGNSNSSIGADTFYWTPAAGMRRLWDVLLAAGVDPAASGWTNLMAANAVSADGKTVVGYGMHLGRYEAFTATVPEPAAVCGVALLSGVLLRRRRRSSCDGVARVVGFAEMNRTTRTPLTTTTD